MSLEGAIGSEKTEAEALGLSLPWRSALARLAIAVPILFAVTWRDWSAMFDQWWNISTYNHILFVPLIIGWLVYLRHDELKQIKPIAWWPGLVPLGAGMMLWLLGTLAGVNTASQLGAVTALASMVPALLGPRVTIACAFPLAYMVFLVPFGDELVPTLQMVTASMVIWLTEASGIPAVVDGVFIDTPAGLFEVAEACSGVKFLIAMIALGVLVCYACFKQWRMRALFMTVAIVLPILANGVRAWGTIYIAQSQGVEFAEGFDHIFYGWVFFAIIVFALLAAFWRTFDREPDELGIDFPELATRRLPARLAREAEVPSRLLTALVAMIASIYVWQLSAAAAEAPMPQTVALPAVPGWEMVDYEPQVEWQPRLAGADHRLLGRYRNAEGREIDVVLAIYAAQSEGREAGAAGEGALVPDTAWRWAGPWSSLPNSQGDELLAFGQVKRFAATTYRTGSLTTGSNPKLKLRSMFDRLLIARNPTMTLILSVESADRDQAVATLADFDKSIGERGEWMDRIAGLR